jgi:dUTP pyrophosphatase
MIQFKFTGILKEDSEGGPYRRLPERGTKNAMAYDFYSPIDFTVEPKQTYLLKTGIKAQFPENIGLVLNVRSSMGKKHIMLANSSGWVDADYYENPDNDGEIGFMFYNYGEDTWEVKAGDKIGQGMFVEYYKAIDDSATAEREGGWGSTGN